MLAKHDFSYSSAERVKRDWYDTMIRLRHERDKFKRFAANCHKDSIKLNAKRHWLEALHAKTLAREYRETARKFHKESMEIKTHWGFR